MTLGGGRSMQQINNKVPVNLPKCRDCVSVGNMWLSQTGRSNTLTHGGPAAAIGLACGRRHHKGFYVVAEDIKQSGKC